MTTHFESKEHYLAFRKAWANAVNDPRAKPYFEPCDEYVYRTNAYGRKIHHNPIISKGTGKRRIPGWLTRSHHILFNLLCNRPIETGFTPITNKNKLHSGMYFNFGLYFATQNLKWFINHDVNRSVKELNKWFKEEHREWAKQQVEKFLAPFDGTVTVDMLLALEIPKIEPMYSHHKLGQEIAEKITAPISHQELWNLYTRGAEL